MSLFPSYGWPTHFRLFRRLMRCTMSRSGISTSIPQPPCFLFPFAGCCYGLDDRRHWQRCQIVPGSYNFPLFGIGASATNFFRSVRGGFGVERIVAETRRKIRSRKAVVYRDALVRVLPRLVKAQAPSHQFGLGISRHSTYYQEIHQGPAKES